MRSIIEEFKSSLKILILGSYSPSGAIGFLEEMRDELIAIGYKKTSLIRDLKDDDFDHISNNAQFNYEKSIHYIKKCDIAIFVYLKGFDNTGVTIELSASIQENMFCNKLILCLDISGNHPVFSSLIQGSILTHCIDIPVPRITFTVRQEAIEKVLSIVKQKAYSLFLKKLAEK